MLRRSFLSSASITRMLGIAAFAAAALLATYSPGPQVLANDLAAFCSATFRAGAAEEAAYFAESASTMSKMMIEMNIRPSGDVDGDFVSMMTPHHQAAIEMAQAELRYGRNKILKRLAQEIIVTQQQEIAAMRLALGQSLPPSLASPDQMSSAEPNMKLGRPIYRVKEP